MAIPRNPPEVTTKRVVVAIVALVVPVGMTMRNRSSVWELMPLMTRGMDAVEVASNVTLALVNGEVVPMASCFLVDSQMNKVSPPKVEALLN